MLCSAITTANLQSLCCCVCCLHFVTLNTTLRPAMATVFLFSQASKRRRQPELQAFRETPANPSEIIH